IVDAHVTTDRPAQFLQPLQQCGDASLPFRIVRRQRREHANTPDATGLLRARRQQPRGRRAAKQRDELPPFHWSLRPVLATGTVAHTSMRQETAVLRNFNPAYNRCGSSTTEAVEATRRCNSASPRKSP